jgi:hypothetical protein
VTRHVITGATLVAGVHFVSLALAAGVLLSPVVALLAFAFWRLVEPEEGGATGYRMVALMTAIGTLVATAASVALGFTPLLAFDWLGILSATGLAAAIFSLTFASRGTTCRLCATAIAAGGGFECPRCADRVCGRPSCWNAKQVRCTRCLERAVVALPMHSHWWKTRFGHKAGRGQCALCFKQADEANLYECGTCAQPLCDRCWDHQNGACSKCGWIIPNLPAKLAALHPARPRDPRVAQDRREAKPAVRRPTRKLEIPSTPVRKRPPTSRRGDH